MAFGQVLFVEHFDALQVFPEWGDDGIGKHRHPVFHPFSISYHNQVLGKINVFDTQPQTFHQSCILNNVDKHLNNSK